MQLPKYEQVKRSMKANIFQLSAINVKHFEIFTSEKFTDFECSAINFMLQQKDEQLNNFHVLAKLNNDKSLKETFEVFKVKVTIEVGSKVFNSENLQQRLNGKF